MSATLPTPSARLERSREQLRLSLKALPAQREERSGGDKGSAAPAWLEALKSDPGARIVVDVVSHWWARHPLRQAADVAAIAATAALKPLAQRHPLGLVAGAVVLGGLLVWFRPWRWPWPTVLAGLLPQLLMTAVRGVPPPHPPPRS